MRRFLFCLSVLLLVYGMHGLHQDHTSRKNAQEYRALIHSSADPCFAAQHFAEDHPDFLGFLVFDSGILSVPVMQDEEQSLYYLDHDVRGNPDPAGVPFTFQSSDDRVMTIYGHLVYYDELASFSPLQVLSDPDICRENRWFRFITPAGELHCEIRAIIRMDRARSECFPLMIQAPDRAWLDYVQRYRLDDGMTFQADDRYIILQTCLRNVPDVHLLFVAVMM